MGDGIEHFFPFEAPASFQFRPRPTRWCLRCSCWRLCEESLCPILLRNRFLTEGGVPRISPRGTFPHPTVEPVCFAVLQNLRKRSCYGRFQFQKERTVNRREEITAAVISSLTLSLYVLSARPPALSELRASVRQDQNWRLPSPGQPNRRSADPVTH